MRIDISENIYKTWKGIIKLSKKIFYLINLFPISKKDFYLILFSVNNKRLIDSVLNILKI